MRLLDKETKDIQKFLEVEYELLETNLNKDRWRQRVEIF